MVVGTQRCGGRATGTTEGYTLFGEGINGACGGVTTACMANDFAPFAILLVVEGEGGVRSAVQVRLRCGVGVEFVVPDGEGNVAQAQWMVVRGVQYSPGRNKKKKAIQIISMAAVSLVMGAAWTRAVAWWMIWIGRGLTRCGAGSSCEWAEYNRVSRGSMSPADVRRRSG